MDLMTDVLVVGGGPSGIAAAISAAREGAKTLIAEKDGLFGGMSTAGLLNVWCGSASCDIWEDIFARTTQRKGRRKVFSPEELKGLYIDLLEEKGVDMLLHTHLIDVEMDGDQISCAVFYGKSGRIRVKAKVYIDSTGDGDMAMLAGVPFEKGRDGDGLMQPMTLEFMVGGVDDEHAVYPTFGTNPDLEAKMKEYVAQGRISEPCGHLILLQGHRPGVACVNTTNVIRVDGTDERDLTFAELHTRRQIPQIMAFLHECVPGYENAYVMASASHIGVRETRRFKGLYQLNEQDILDQRIFEDWIVSDAEYAFGVHNPEGSGGGKNSPRYHGERYTIPYRCFLNDTAKNMLLNGRNISGTHLAHSSYRVMPICFAMGEGTGTAAALAVKKGCELRSVPAEEIQKALLSRGIRQPSPKEISKDC